jgi:hypothetical protein
MDSRNARPGREDEPGGDHGQSEVSTLPESFEIRMFNADQRLCDIVLLEGLAVINPEQP